MASKTIQAKYPAQVVAQVSQATADEAAGQAALEGVSKSEVLRRWMEMGRKAENALRDDDRASAFGYGGSGD